MEAEGPVASLVFTKANNLPVIATDWLIGFSCWYHPAGGGGSTAYVLRQDSEIARRVQQDVNVLIKITVFCQFEG